MIHARLTYRIILAIGILLPLSGCGRGDATQAEVAALRQEIAQIKLAQATMRGSIVALKQAVKSGEVAAPAPGAEDRDVIHEIPISSAPRKGNPTAAVTVVEFADFQCPFCQAAAGLPDNLLAEFPNDVQFAFKHYPLERHPYAVGAAKAAWAAQQQGKFWEMHNLIYGGNIDENNVEALRGYAQRLGLDMARFDADMSSPKAQQVVVFDKQAGRKIKLGGTPSYFVNGRRVDNGSAVGVRAMVVEEIAKRKQDAGP